MNNNYNNAERLRLVIFTLARNSYALPCGLELGISMEEINRMSYEVMLELIDGNGDIIDWDKAKESYKQGKEIFERGNS